MFAIEHPNDQTLASLWGEDLAAARTESILTHLDSCPGCAQRLAAMDSSIQHYGRIVQLVDAQLPDPPRAWADIAVAMDRVDRARAADSESARSFSSAKAHPRRPVWISAIAAAILLVFLIWPRDGSVARAETLLVRAKSAAARARSRKSSRLRVATGHTAFVRPAVLASDSPANDPLHAQFLTARYDWNDPLSAAAFWGWREQLRHKTDRVSESAQPAQYRLETITADTPLRDASIVFAGPDLTPVSLRLLFDGGTWVEITALPEPAPTTPATIEGGPAKVPAPPDPRETDRQLAERELAVRLAIAALSDNTPVPVTVEVAPQGSIIVTPYHLSPQQERQLRESLAGREGVLLNPTERDGGLSIGPKSASDEEPALGTAGVIASLAHLIAEDADRFPQDRELLLEPSGRAALRDLRIRRTEQLIAHLDKLNRQLAASHELPALQNPPPALPESNPSLAGLEQAAAALNRLVTAAYATGAEHIDLDIAAPELTRGMGEVLLLARQYDRHLRQPARERR